MFRKEVLNARAEHKHGSVILIRPVSSWIFVACTVFIVASITAYLVLGSYTKRATATGSLLPVNGLVRIIPPIAGMVSERRVEEGQHVRKGDILFVLSDERSQVNGGKIIALREIHATSLEQRRISLQRAREASQLLAKQAQHGLKNKIVMLKNELSHNNQQVDLQKSRVNAAIKILQKHRQLEQEQFISTLALQEKEDAVAAQRSQLLSLQRQNTELKRNLVAI
ncbi:biotin/lipoyl-binding protein [Aquaspirillum sp. LM1]|uniref:biotin/lipoyl-binding protein n=1 Tax=Aquaspirillum sp. LM1 TaxID=1938604 RepID=UPI0015C5262F|nr:biotin/lipoyl-binding protein [Aquaspirillum sp. LM1]